MLSVRLCWSDDTLQMLGCPFSPRTCFHRLHGNHGQSGCSLVHLLQTCTTPLSKCKNSLVCHFPLNSIFKHKTSYQWKDSDHIYLCELMREIPHCWDVVAVKSPLHFHPWAFFPADAIWNLLPRSHRSQSSNQDYLWHRIYFFGLSYVAKIYNM